MFIAMNRFRVTLGNEDEFEAVWSARESYLNELPGFLEFSLLRGPLRDNHRLYASHTVWTSRDAFARWTQSDQFRKAHARAGQGKPLTRVTRILKASKRSLSMTIARPGARRSEAMSKHQIETARSARIDWPT